MVVSLLAAIAGWRRTVLASLILASLVLIATTNTPLGNALLLPLEQRFQRADLSEDPAGIIVLGGGIESVISERRGVIEQGNAADRLYEAAMLARRFPNAKLVYTGGPGSVFNQDHTGAEAALRYLISFGIDERRVTIEKNSRNTFENAVLSSEIVELKAGDKWVLVTSAFHMPRAIGVFRKQGWHVLPWPCDFRTFGPEAVRDFSSSTHSNLSNLSLAIKEWVGLSAYLMTDRIDSIFPAPEPS